MLKESVHLLTPDGHDMAVHSGRYRVESADDSLQFISEVCKVQPIAADVATHEKEIDVPVPVSLKKEVKEFKDLHLVMLSLPEGQSLEAIGSYSSVRKRGILRTKITKFPSSLQPRIPLVTNQVQPDHMVQLVTLFASWVGLWFYDPSVPQVKKVQPSRGQYQWPASYDLYPKLSHLTWVPMRLKGTESPSVGAAASAAVSGPPLTRFLDKNNGDIHVSG